MNCLITGSNGFLGKELVRELTGSINFICLSRRSCDYKLCLEKNVPLFKHDFDMVVHAAGLAHVSSKDMVNVNLFNQVNVLGTQNLLKGLERRKLPKAFVFISSVAVYGLSEGYLIN